jgi:hypothetical protein
MPGKLRETERIRRQKEENSEEKTLIERKHGGGKTSLSDRSVLIVAEGGAV